MDASEENTSDGSLESFETALEVLSTMITPRRRSDKPETFLLKMHELLKVLELEESIKHLKVIHVAGTKGKGSTCAFVESILKACGFHTGLFTSPHLISICERFCLDGTPISERKFQEYFWRCWKSLKEKRITDMHFFQFLTILAFKIFVDEKVDVAIIEVGLGGTFDATNVVNPVVCGITSLGYDHMEILGNTLKQIAGEKAGIMKVGVPAFTVPQPEEAMEVLRNRSSELSVTLNVVSPLDLLLLGDHQLGLDGDHQFKNAGLAVSLCHAWLKRTGNLKHLKFSEIILKGALPEPFIKGLSMAKLAGRAQIIQNSWAKERSNSNDSDRLIFYLDGAHSPESMEACANWFSHVIKSCPSSSQFSERKMSSKQILLFSCMPVRDPSLLLSHLVNTCSQHGVFFQKALFVPSSSFNDQFSRRIMTTEVNPSETDISWQYNIQRIWEMLVQENTGPDTDRSSDTILKSSASGTLQGSHHENDHCMYDISPSTVLPSVTTAIRWLREFAQSNQSQQLKVLVTGSLHLVGDVLKMLKK